MRSLRMFALLFLASYLAQGQTPPPPTITFMSPAAAEAKSSEVLITITGTGFSTLSKVRFGGAELYTSCNGATQLTAVLPAALMLTPGDFRVEVANLLTVSNTKFFTLTSPTPVITSVVPSAIQTGDSNFTFEVSGPKFFSGSTVFWNGAPLATTYNFSGTLTATGSGALRGSAGLASVTVVNPANATPSNPVQFRVFVASAISGLNPSTATRGGPGFTLTLNGSGFEQDALVLWNGTPLPTTLVSSTQLSAAVPASMLTSAGVKTISVGGLNPSSNTAVFTVTGLTPAITTCVPEWLSSDAYPASITVQGTGFATGATLAWGGVPLSTKATSMPTGIVLTASVPANLLRLSGIYEITVVNPGGASSNGFPIQVRHQVSAVAPSIVSAGSHDSVITVSGAGFTPAASVEFVTPGGVMPLSTDYAGTTQLTATVPAPLLAVEGSAGIQVRDVVGVSRLLEFKINPAPVIDSVTATTYESAYTSFTLRVTGHGFFAGCAVRLNGSPLQTFTLELGLGALTASIPDALVAKPGADTVDVDCLGVVSNSRTITVTRPEPNIRKIEPPGFTAGRNGFTMVLYGSGFFQDSVVTWSGTPLATTFVNSMELRAAISADLVALGGKYEIQVINGADDSRSAVSFIFGRAELTRISPSSATSAASDIQLTLTGVGFVPATTAMCQLFITPDVPLQTTYVNSTTITALLPATLLQQQDPARGMRIYVVTEGMWSAYYSFSVGSLGLKSILPTSASAGGPAFQLAVSGGGFVAGSVVQWNGSALTTVYANQNLLYATVPEDKIATAGTAQVNVTNPDGALPGTAKFTIMEATPVLSALKPSVTYAGSPDLRLEVNGSSFAPGATVMWNETPLATTFVSSGVITAIVPASYLASVGSASISVRNPSGAITQSRPFQVSASLLYYTTPGSLVAGRADSPLTVNGIGFVPGAQIQWNGQLLESSYVTNSAVGALVPAALIATPGIAIIRVVSGGVTSSDHLEIQIQRPTPVLTSMAPGEVDAGSGNFILTVSGSDLRSEMKVYWDGAPLSTSFESVTRMSATVPAALLQVAAGHSITVGYDDGVSSQELDFDVRPVLQSVTPASVPAGSPDTMVTITGIGFSQASTAEMRTGLHGSALVITKYVNSTTLTATISTYSLSAASENSVFVRSPGVFSQSLPFSVKGGFVLGSLNPGFILAGTPGFTMTLRGAEFASTDVVNWNDAPLATTWVSSGELRAAVPATLVEKPGQASLKIVRPDGTATNSLPYMISAPRPSLSRLNPSSATVGSESLLLTVVGSGFVEGVIVSWEDTPLSTKFVSAMELTVIVPGALLQKSGFGWLTATNPASATSDPLSFAIREGISLDTISPRSALAGGPGFTLTAYGTGFAAGAKVRWNSVDLNTQYFNPSQLSAFVPPDKIAVPGAAGITVVNPNGMPSSSTLQFAVDAPPIISAITPDSADAGTEGFILTATGSSFSAGTVLYWNRTPLTTVFVSSNQLTAFVPGSLTFVGGASIRAVLQSGFSSNSIPFKIRGGTSILAATPNRIDAGGPPLTLTVWGEGFVPGSKVTWAGADLITIYRNEISLQATVPAALIAASGACDIAVVNPARGWSNSIPVYVQPVLAEVEPKSAPAGSPDVIITVKGAGFVPSNVIVFFASEGKLGLSTTYVDSSTLTAILPAHRLVAARWASLSISDASGTFSGTAPFRIGDAPKVQSFSPNSATYGGPGFTLTVNGEEFQPGAIVVWNRTTLNTTFVNPSRLTAFVPANLIGASSLSYEASVYAVNVDGFNNASSNALAFVIAPAIATVSPSSTVAGGPSFTLTIDGAGFQPNSVALWNGIPLTTWNASSTRLEADVPASLIITPQRAVVGVGDPTLRSAGMPFQVLGTFIPSAPAQVVNAASYEMAVAPGSLVSVLGVNLTNVEANSAVTPASTRLDGVSLLINGSAVPLLYVSPGQINAQLPFDIPPGPARLQVEAEGRTSAVMNFNVSAAAPGVFFMPPGNHAVAQNYPDWSLNSPGNAARPGQHVTVFLTGLGEVDYPVRAGTPAPREPLARALGAVTAKVGGTAAEVTFAGLAPGYVGLAQVNLIVPDVALGEQPLEITVGGVKSNLTNLSIREK